MMGGISFLGILPMSRSRLSFHFSFGCHLQILPQAQVLYLYIPRRSSQQRPARMLVLRTLTLLMSEGSVLHYSIIWLKKEKK